MRALGPVAWLVAIALSMRSFTWAATLTPLAIDAGAFSTLTVSPNGQTVYAVDESRRAVVAFEPASLGKIRDAVAPLGPGDGMPLAVAAAPGELLALACRRDDRWSLLAYRLRPAGAVDAASQRLPLGEAAGKSAPMIAVSRSRDWLAVIGLPAPLPPIIRAVVAGGGLRLVPEGRGADAIERATAIAVSPADETVVVEPGDAGSSDTVVFIGAGGRELLRLPIGLRGVRGAAFTREPPALHVITGGDADHGAGLWRLEADLREGLQAVRPTRLLALVEPRAVAAVSGSRLVVVHGEQPRVVSLIDAGDEREVR